MPRISATYVHVCRRNARASFRIHPEDGIVVLPVSEGVLKRRLVRPTVPIDPALWDAMYRKGTSMSMCGMMSEVDGFCMPRCTAQANGVQPSMSSSSRPRVPLPKRVRSASSWPCPEAHGGVRPLSSALYSSTLRLWRRTSMAPLCPLPAAHERGVRPVLSGRLGSTPLTNSDEWPSARISSAGRKRQRSVTGHAGTRTRTEGQASKSGWGAKTVLGSFHSIAV